MCVLKKVNIYIQASLCSRNTQTRLQYETSVFCIINTWFEFAEAAVSLSRILIRTAVV